MDDIFDLDDDDMDGLILEDEPEVVEEVIAVAPVKKVNYLNNKDMLKEIHKSKNSFCEYVDPKYGDYDVIVENQSDIFDTEVQDRARAAKAARMAAAAFEIALDDFINGKSTRKDRPKLSEFKFDPSAISVDDLVFRVLTFDHIPLAPGRKKKPKSTADNYIKLNFYPFKHFIIENGVAKEVGKSHYYKGKFSLEHGSITVKLAKMFILMVNKYSQRGNWRGYTYIDEMKGQSLLQLSQMGLQFDEYKSDNPFSYYTACVSTSFTRVFNLEKKNQTLRDDLLIDSGASPSFSRQLAVEDEIRRLREEAEAEAKKGE
jgi:hypothetical protein